MPQALHHLRCLLAALVAALAVPAAAEDRVFGHEYLVRETETGKLYGMAVDYPAPGSADRIGFLAYCTSSGQVELHLQFYFFPPSEEVQAFVQSPDGQQHIFGPHRHGGRNSGFHIEVLREPERIISFAHAFLAPGAVLSDGAATLVNVADAAASADVLADLVACVSEGAG